MFTGAGENKLVVSIVVVLLVMTLLMVWYVWVFAKDKVILGEKFCCGGQDQKCQCDGNEKMTTFRVSDNVLSATLAGVR